MRGEIMVKIQNTGVQHPEKSKNRVNFGKKPYLTTYQGGKGNMNNEKIPNTEAHNIKSQILREATPSEKIES